MYECYEIDCPYCNGTNCCMEGGPVGECEMYDYDDEEMEVCIEYNTTQYMMNFLNWYFDNYEVYVDFKGMTQKEYIETVFSDFCIKNNITEVINYEN